jgi:hypothetical protein
MPQPESIRAGAGPLSLPSFETTMNSLGIVDVNDPLYVF